MLVWYIFLLALLASVIGCSKRVEKKRALTVVKNSSSQLCTTPFKITVKGVECRLCAQAVVNALHASAQYKDVLYWPQENSYEKGHITLLQLDAQHSVSPALINKILEKEGFVCSSIEGQFIGRYSFIEDKLCFVLANTGELFLVTEREYTPTAITDKSYPWQLDKIITVSGIIWLEQKSGNYWLYPRS